MPSKRTFFNALSVLTIVVMVVAASPTALATTEPPFEIRFPQQTSVTEFDSTFGAGRSGGRRHKGNDLMAPKMTPVYAAADGVVVTISDGSTSGRYLTIDHVDGWSTSYMHLNNDDPGTDNGRADWSHTLAPGIEEGVSVSAGQLIGFVGDSGNAEWTGSHTHFELRKNGTAVNPYNLLLEAFRRDELLLVGVDRLLPSHVIPAYME